MTDSMGRNVGSTTPSNTKFADDTTAVGLISGMSPLMTRWSMCLVWGKQFAPQLHQDQGTSGLEEEQDGYSAPVHG